MLAGTSAGIFTTYQTSIGMFRVCKHDGPIAATQPRDPPAPPRNVPFVFIFIL